MGTEEEAVTVGLAKGRKPGVKIGRYLLGLEDSDAPGTEAVNSSLESFNRHVATGGEIGYLPQRVNTGIRPPRPLQGDPLAGQTADYLLEDPLDRWSLRLDLPTDIWPPVVLQEKTDVPLSASSAFRLLQLTHGCTLQCRGDIFQGTWHGAG